MMAVPMWRAQPLVCTRRGSCGERAAAVRRGRCLRQSVVAGWLPNPFAEKKTVYLIRHGNTEMNTYLETRPYGSPGFNDPLWYDTRLTPKGEKQARSLNSRVKELSPAPEVLLASPLTRALCTSELAFEGVDIPREVCPLASERVWMSSDVGRKPAIVQSEFPSWDLSGLSELWWYHTDAENAAKEAPVVEQEPKEVFEKRMAELIEYLEARPERTLALVCHKGVIVSITGECFKNCEMRKFNVRALKPLSVFAE